MGVFTRVRDIISANLNSMLDRAEDPEKMVKLMIREMEDALVEVKASCAGAMATKKKTEREAAALEARADEWARKAELALSREREELAREALLEKKRFVKRAEATAEEVERCKELVDQYQNDILQLEEKLETARERQRSLVQRHVHARQKKRAQSEIRKADTLEAVMKFEGFEQRIDRMEAEADLVNYGRGRKRSLEEEFEEMAEKEEIEQELEALRKKASPTEAGE